MIEVNGLTKYYGPTRAVYDLSFTIESGRIVGFLGLNGAGKTTVLKVLAGYLLPTSGSVHIAGVDLIAKPEAMRARIGFLPEKPPLYDEMTVAGYLRYLGELRGVSSRKLVARIPEVLELTALEGHDKQRIGTLSLGYRKRVGIAQAIIHDPDLLILDEPIAGLDPVQIVEMRKLIRSLGGKHTILLSSHILTEVEETCDQLLVLDNGELVAQGTEDELLARFSHSLEFDLVVQGDPQVAADIIAAAPLVTEVRSGRIADGFARFELSLSRDEPAGLVTALVQAGLGVHRMEPSRGALEAAFLSMTGRGGAS
jgi:ABC-2 type transport system ATP-binding protein